MSASNRQTLGQAVLSQRSSSSSSSSSSSVPTTLFEYVTKRGSAEQQLEFVSSWSWYIRQVLGIPREHRHVWPYNVEFGLKCALARFAREFVRTKAGASNGNPSVPVSTSFSDWSSLDLDTFLEILDSRQQHQQQQQFDPLTSVVRNVLPPSSPSFTTQLIQQIDPVDIPGQLTNIMQQSALTDPYGFPNDSAVYRDWKTISSAVSTIDQMISNIQIQSRTMTLQNKSLESDIQRLRSLAYVQERFKDKFDLVERSVREEDRFHF